MVRINRRGRSTTVPFIRLSGKWLEQAGFYGGDYLAIRVQRHEISLVPQTRGVQDAGEK